jgi:predicted naringenin-chalcone synthase
LALHEVSMTTAYINRIATAVPPHDIHDAFLAFAESQLGKDPRKTALFRRMSERSGIDHRYSCFTPGTDPSQDAVDAASFYTRRRFPDTAARMRAFERFAPQLAVEAIDKLGLGEDRRNITHLVITCCTGFSAPGLDLEIVERCALPPSVERTMIGFMGCSAAINALKVARHVVRSEPSARVLVVNLELCTLHLKETDDIEQILSFLIFADGCAASLISANPVGIALDRFHAILAPDTRELITWHIRDSGFDMVLSGLVPGVIHTALTAEVDAILAGAEAPTIDLWAVHPGGRSVLDAVEHSLRLAPTALAASREVLRSFGNMSSATVMFVLKTMLHAPARRARGCGMAFGPGLVAETMLFHTGG